MFSNIKRKDKGDFIKMSFGDRFDNVEFRHELDKPLDQKLNDFYNDLNKISWNFDALQEWELSEMTKAIGDIMLSLHDLVNLSEKDQTEYSGHLRKSINRRAQKLHELTKQFKQNSNYLRIDPTC